MGLHLKFICNMMSIWIIGMAIDMEVIKEQDKKIWRYSYFFMEGMGRKITMNEVTLTL